jgi:pimeloyl-ACP methyl ester carboxylesterase
MQVNIDGFPAYAYTGGRSVIGKRPAVMFIHGAQHDHSVWILQSRYLAHHGFDVLALDLPGHGRSAGAPLPTIERMSDWVAAMARACGIGPALLCGHSMGSLVALQCAADHPDVAAGIALVASAAPMKVSDALLEAARTDEPRAFDMINAWSHATLNARPGCPGPGFSIFVQNRRLMERQATGVLLNDFSACNAYDQAFDAARRVACPALMVLGGRDMMTPPKAAKALATALTESARAQHLPAPQITEVPGCGHALMSERPDAVLEALHRFTRSVQFKPDAQPASA